MYEKKVNEVFMKNSEMDKIDSRFRIVDNVIHNYDNRIHEHVETYK